jgi:predicted Zn-dependent protease with MMP-like domain
MTPEEFPAEQFHQLVSEAIDSLPRRFREAMVNMAIVVEDEPTPDQLRQVEVEPPDTIYGLYEGIPLPERQWAHGNVLPDKISIFRVPILEDSLDEDDIVVGIGETLIHEVGHYFGLSEEEIMDIEEKYWRGEGQD